MIVPSGELWSTLNSTHGGIFFENVLGEDKNLFFAKLQSSLIKAIFSGIPFEVVIGIYSHSLKEQTGCCVGLRVIDDPIKPIVHFRLIRDRKEFQMLQSAFSQPDNIIQFVDELGRLVVSGNTKVSEEFLSELKEFSKYEGVITELDRNTKNYILDRFEDDLDCIHGGGYPSAIEWMVAPIEFYPHKPIETYIIGTPGSYMINLQDEGGALEKSVYPLVESSYGKYTYLSPTVGVGGRELTDVFAMAPGHYILVEAKALSVLKNIESLTVEKATKNIRKDIIKGLKQICGALRTIRAEHDIFSTEGSKIGIDKDEEVVAHGIILISDMHTHLDWEWVAKELIETSKKHEALIHVMDLHELQQLIGRVKTPKLISLNLINRIDAVFKSGCAYVRVRAPQKKN